MNSSSKKIEAKENNNLSKAAVAEGSGEQVKNVDLLELTLGFGSASAASSKAMQLGLSSLIASHEQSSISSFSTKQTQDTPLGLKLLGFETGNPQVDPSSENNPGLWCGQHHQYLSNNSLNPLIPSPSCSSSLVMSSPWIPPHHCHTSPSPCSSNYFPSVHRLPWPVPNVCSSGRPHPGLWFSLRSVMNRDGEVLPQIPKAYIRVKNENVTVFLVKTYLVRKLGLSNEAQVEISCMGQNLLHSQSLKTVRDEIWLPKVVEFLNYSNTTLDPNSHNMRAVHAHHIMSLDYGKCCSFFT